MAEDADQHDGVIKDRQHGDAAAGDDAIVEAGRPVGEAHRIAHDVADVGVIGQEADAQVARRQAFAIAAGMRAALRRADLLIREQNLDGTGGRIDEQLRMLGLQDRVAAATRSIVGVVVARGGRR